MLGVAMGNFGRSPANWRRSPMNNKVLTGLCVGVCLVLLCGPAFAHHGGAAYDNANPLTLKGTVKEFHFIQPHPLIALEVKDDKGSVVDGPSKRRRQIILSDMAGAARDSSRVTRSRWSAAPPGTA